MSDLWPSTFLSELGLESGGFSVSDTHVRIIGPQFEEVYPLEAIRMLERNVERLRCCPGFDESLLGLRNPTQFGSTLFEFNCAMFCVVHYAATALRFAPEVVVNGREKRPDFEFTSGSGIQVIAECKSLASIERARQSRAFRLVQVLTKSVGDIIPDIWRVEMAFKALPAHWNRNFGDQMKGAVSELIRRAYVAKPLLLKFESGIGVFVKLCHRDEPIHFKGTLNAGDTLPVESPPKLIVAETMRWEQNLVRTIKDALTQLPSDRPSTIFLYPVSHQDCESVVCRFFKHRRVPALTSIHSWTEKVTRYWNPHSSIPSEALRVMLGQP